MKTSKWLLLSGIVVASLGFERKVHSQDCYVPYYISCIEMFQVFGGGCYSACFSDGEECGETVDFWNISDGLYTWAPAPDGEQGNETLDSSYGSVSCWDTYTCYCELVNLPDGSQDYQCGNTAYSGYHEDFHTLVTGPVCTGTFIP